MRDAQWTFVTGDNPGLRGHVAGEGDATPHDAHSDRKKIEKLRNNVLVKKLGTLHSKCLASKVKF